MRNISLVLPYDNDLLSYFVTFLKNLTSRYSYLLLQK